MSNKEIYETAHKNYTPSPDDGVENLPFYRCWHALKTLLAYYGYADPYSAPINAHSICCWEKSGVYDDFVKILSMHTPTPPVKTSRVRCLYWAEPQKPTEKDAYAIFSRHYKLKFQHRLNSKHAKEKWLEVRGKAWLAAEQDYQVAKDDYDFKLAKHNAEVDKEEAEHQEKVVAYNKAIELIEKLKG